MSNFGNFIDPSGVTRLRATGGGGGGSSDIKLATLPLTDADIKALPVTSLTAVAHPGAGKLLMPLFATLMIDHTAGDYTNISATGQIQLNWGGSGGALTAVAINLQEGLAHAKVSGLLANGTKCLAMQGGPLDLMDVGTSGAFSAGSWIDLGNDYSAADDMPLVLEADNPAGAFTGGNAANRGLVTVVYYTITLP